MDSSSDHGNAAVVVQTARETADGGNARRRKMAEEEGGGGNGAAEEADSVEKIFESKEVPTWQQQLTVRAFAVSLVLGVLFTFIVMKLNLTTGIIPSLNVSAGLLGFFFVKTWTKLLDKTGLLRQPFTRQENTVIQTCVVASSGIAFSGCVHVPQEEETIVGLLRFISAAVKLL